MREIHVCFLNPRHGEAPLRWAELPKCEATIDRGGCGPQSRGCDDLPEPAPRCATDRTNAIPTSRPIRAFSSEVETGSRQENASNQKSKPAFRFHRNGSGSSRPISWRTVRILP